MQLIWSSLLIYLNDLQFLLINFKKAGYQDEDGNILIKKAEQIKDHRPNFGVIETSFGTTSKVQIIFNLKNNLKI